jgi:hypothetical protein
MAGEPPDIVDRLMDLHKQAVVERSHHNVGKCCEDAIKEIVVLRGKLKQIKTLAASK